MQQEFNTHTHLQHPNRSSERLAIIVVCCLFSPRNERCVCIISLCFSFKNASIYRAAVYLENIKYHLLMVYHNTVQPPSGAIRYDHCRPYIQQTLPFHCPSSVVGDCSVFFLQDVQDCNTCHGFGHSPRSLFPARLITPALSYLLSHHVCLIPSSPRSCCCLANGIRVLSPQRFSAFRATKFAATANGVTAPNAGYQPCQKADDKRISAGKRKESQSSQPAGNFTSTFRFHSLLGIRH